MMESQAHSVNHDTPFQHPQFNRDVFLLKWGETPDVDVVNTRNGVLAEFLHLMQDMIPSSQLEEKSLIVLPDPPKIVT